MGVSSVSCSLSYPNLFARERKGSPMRRGDIVVQRRQCDAQAQHASFQRTASVATVRRNAPRQPGVCVRYSREAQTRGGVPCVRERSPRFASCSDRFRPLLPLARRAAQNSRAPASLLASAAADTVCRGWLADPWSAGGGRARGAAGLCRPPPDRSPARGSCSLCRTGYDNDQRTRRLPD